MMQINRRFCHSIKWTLVAYAMLSGAASLAQTKVSESNKTNAKSTIQAKQANKLAEPEYIVRALKGDTPLSIAQRFYRYPAPAADLANFFKRNKISGQAIHKVVAVNTPFTVSVASIHTIPVFATVISLAGAVSYSLPMRDGKNGDAIKIDAASQIPESAMVSTGVASGLKLRLPDGSIVSVLDNSTFRLAQLKQLVGTDIFQIELSDLKGRLETKVTPLRSQAGTFNIKSQRTITGVRGTQFNVSDRTGGNAVVEVLEGAVALTDLGDGAVSLLPGFGSYVRDRQASAPTPLLDQPDIHRIGPILQQIYQPVSVDQANGTVAVRMDIYLANDPDQKVLHSTQGKLNWPTELKDGEYIAAIRSVDRNGLNGEPVFTRLTINHKILAPELAWVGATQSLSIDHPHHDGALLLEQRPFELGTQKPQAKTDAKALPLNVQRRILDGKTRHISIEDLPSGHHEIRAASVLPAARVTSDTSPASIAASNMGYFSPWIHIFKP